MDTHEHSTRTQAYLSLQTQASSNSLKSYGIDLEISTIVQRLQNRYIYNPDFQRGYSWDIVKASRFIDTLLRGEPVPAIFVYRDANSRYLVVDGHQRLETLRRFYSGKFGPEGEQNAPSFRLASLDDITYRGLLYEDLPLDLKTQLDDYPMHQVIFEQTSEPTNMTAVYRVFERLNSGSVQLTAQELRSAINQGSLNDLLRELSADERWLEIYGTNIKTKQSANRTQNPRAQEVILRFLALYDIAINNNLESYKPTMKDFLDNYMKVNANQPSPEQIDSLRQAFKRTIEVVYSCIERGGVRSFRPQDSWNVSVYEAVMVGLALRLSRGSQPDCAEVLRAYNKLLRDKGFSHHTSQAVTNKDRLVGRIRLAEQYFASTLWLRSKTLDQTSGAGETVWAICSSSIESCVPQMIQLWTIHEGIILPGTCAS